MLLLSACSSPDEKAVEATPDISDQQNLESDVAEPEETPVIVEVEPEPDASDDDSVIESKSSDMDFSTCVQQQSEFAEAILSSGNYNVIPVVNTSVLSIVKFCTNDDSIIHTCSAPDNKMVVVKSTNREGC